MDARKPHEETILTSKFFQLPRQNTQDHEREDAYAKRLSANIRTQISMTNGDEIAIAEDLVQLCKKMPRELAIYILFDTTKNSPFKQVAAREIIVRGIDEEDMARSPLNKYERTCAAIKRYQIDHADEVDYFLRHPDRLLFWIENAPTVEISRLFSYYFKTGKEELETQKEYSNHMQKLAEAEIEAGKPGKAIVCIALMRRGQLNQHGQSTLLAAIQAIEANEPNRLNRTLQSARVKLYANIENIKNASGCFVSTFRLNLPETNFNMLHLDGARMDSATLHQSSFVDASLQGAEFQHSILTNADLRNARAQGANFSQAQLTDSLLMDADLRGANLVSANLTRANLYGAFLNATILEGANLSDAIFFSRSMFKFSEKVEAEFNRLAVMLKDHAYYTLLHDAILNDLLKHMQSPTIAEATRMQILEKAYHHPLFNHSQFSVIKSIANTAAAILPSAIMGFFWKPSDTTQLEQPCETKAQTAIRELLAQYKCCLITPESMRPLPPKVAPSSF